MSSREQPSSDERVERIVSPTPKLRWKRSYDGFELSKPVLQQLFAVALYNPRTMHTNHFEEWMDVPEAGPNE